MDRRRTSYASVAGGTSGNQRTASADGMSHLMNPSPSSPSRNPFYPAATAERTPYSYSHAEDGNSKNTASFWGRTGTTQATWNDTDDGQSPAPPRMTIRPSYLAGSTYLERLDAQHKARIARQTGHKTPSLSKSSSGTSLHRLAPSHRGMTYELVENMPQETEDDLTPPLPSKWGEKDKNGGLEIIADTEIKYVGTTRGHELDAAATRSDHPIPRKCGIYYFEVSVLKKGKDGMIAIGFSTQKAVLEKLPGWEPESWAYHGDDGKIFGCAQVGKSFGPVFSAEDTVGCGINFRTGKSFFTKNGSFINYAFHDLREVINYKPIYASIGMKRPGAHIKVNFGQTPFEFDIDLHVRNDRDIVREEIATRDISQLHSKVRPPLLVAAVISQYLRHEGFVQTAESFDGEVVLETASLDQSPQATSIRHNKHDIHAVQRQQIRSAILRGDIDTALALTQDNYPSVLETNPMILFRLKCRKFIEMLQFPAFTSSQINPVISKGKSKSDQEMDIDGQSGFQQDNGLALYSADVSATDRLNQALAYAQELRAEYKTDDSKEVSQALGEIFALFAYEDPRNSPAARLLDTTGRLPVAEGLNSAILVSLGAPSATALETIYQQTQSLLEDNVDHGGSGALINLDRNIDRSMDRIGGSTGLDIDMANV